MKKILKYKSLFWFVAVIAVGIYGITLLKPTLAQLSMVSYVENMPAAIGGAEQGLVIPPELSAPEVPPVSATTTNPAEPVLYQYFEVTGGCGPYYQGECLNMRSGPGENYPVVLRLRTGMVFRVLESVLSADESLWYKVQVDDAVRYPERVNGDWYVSAEYVRPFYDDGDHFSKKGMKASTTKHIVVDISEQMLYAYDGDELFMKEPISTGLDFTPTPTGKFRIFKMTPSRYMQGPLPNVSEQVYDLPGVPWNMYFTHDGAVIHGSYWHDHFGKPWSHGCVNLPPEKAKELYYWVDMYTPVLVEI